MLHMHKWENGVLGLEIKFLRIKSKQKRFIVLIILSKYSFLSSRWYNVKVGFKYILAFDILFGVS